MAEDEGAAATWAFAGGDGGVAPSLVGAYVAYVFFAGLFGVAVGFDETVMDADNLLVGKVFIFELADCPGYLVPVDDWSGGVNSEAALPGECDY